jgi:hypothetical protein
MQRYLISFDDGTMIFPEEDLQAVSDATHAVMREAQAAGVWVFGGGLHSQAATIVNTDTSVVQGPYPETKAVLGGFCILEVPTHQDAVAWATKFAVSCRCAQEVREIMFDPLV